MAKLPEGPWEQYDEVVFGLDWDIAVNSKDKHLAMTIATAIHGLPELLEAAEEIKKAIFAAKCILWVNEQHESAEYLEIKNADLCRAIDACRVGED